MPFKPGKYELKIFWACKTSAGYTLYAITYNGKGDQLYRNLGQDIVFRLLEPYYQTGRDVCSDNFLPVIMLQNQWLKRI